MKEFLEIPHPNKPDIIFSVRNINIHDEILELIESFVESYNMQPKFIKVSYPIYFLIAEHFQITDFYNTKKLLGMTLIIGNEDYNLNITSTIPYIDENGQKRIEIFEYKQKHSEALNLQRFKDKGLI